MGIHIGHTQTDITLIRSSRPFTARHEMHPRVASMPRTPFRRAVCFRKAGKGEDLMERREFGTVITRKRKDGTIQTWMGRYTYKGVRCQRSFGPRGRVSAEKWLEEEQLLVDLDRRGVMEWLPPRTRESQRKASALTFNEFADYYIAHHRRQDGGELTGSSKRNLRADVRHLRDAFGEMRLVAITPSMIRDWYEGEHPEGPWAFKRECERLKAILTDAASPGIDGEPPIIESNPFRLPIPPDPEPESRAIRPLDADTIGRIYWKMPEYTRVAVLLAAMAGGMRTGELCALRREDVDLEHRTLSVNGSVNRGPDDLGRSRIGRTKSRHSVRTCPIPDLLVPVLRKHMDALDADDPMLIQTKRGDVIAQTTLEGQFKTARERLGLDQPVTFRTLRVTHTTLMLMTGGTVRETMDEIGDSTMQVVMQHYARTVPEHQRQVVNQIARTLAGDDAGLARTLRDEPAQACGPGVRPELVAGIRRVLALIDDALDQG